MCFYIIAPFSVAGMSYKEPFIALGVVLIWGIYGAIFFIGRSKKTGKEILLTKPSAATV
jgi:hypothetical protein